MFSLRARMDRPHRAVAGVTFGAPEAETPAIRDRERPMTVIEAILLAISVVVFVYLGIAMFRPEWF